MTDKSLDLGRGPILPLLLRMSWPSMAAMLSMALYNLMDTLWLARTSHQAVAALTVNFPVQMILAALGVGTGVGAGSYAARMFGAGNLEAARKTAGQVFLLTFAFGTLLIILTLANPDGLLRLFGASDDILPMARSYLTIVIFTSPCVLFFMMVNNLLRAEGRPNLSMHVVLVFSAIGMVLDPIFILGWGPIPAMGIRGAAYSAVISQSAAALLSLYFISLRSSRYRLDRSLLLPDPGILRSIFQTGFPSIIMNFVVSAVIVVFNHALAPFGDEALATLGMCFRVNGVVMMLLFGVGHGVMPMVGFSAGARSYERLIETVREATRFSLILAVASFLLIEILAPQVLGLFSTDPRLMAMAVPALRIFVSAMVIIAPALVWINMFIGLGKGSTAMWLMFIRDMLLLVPLLIILPPFFGVSGVWLAQPLSSVVAFFIIRHRALREIRSFREAAAV
ncbi:MAG TPA: MATE family efflux transporter [Syntrophales bacterium]|nr:MATE family efflux transporter [Syntrophales bacterium]